MGLWIFFGFLLGGYGVVWSDLWFNAHMLWIVGGLCLDLWFNSRIFRWWLSFFSSRFGFWGDWWWFHGLCSFGGGCWWFLLIWGGWWWLAILSIFSFQTLENIYDQIFYGKIFDPVKYFSFENILHWNKRSVKNYFIIVVSVFSNKQYPNRP